MTCLKTQPSSLRTQMISALSVTSSKDVFLFHLVNRLMSLKSFERMIGSSMAPAELRTMISFQRKLMFELIYMLVDTSSKNSAMNVVVLPSSSMPISIFLVQSSSQVLLIVSSPVWWLKMPPASRMEPKSLKLNCNILLCLNLCTFLTLYYFKLYLVLIFSMIDSLE